MSVLYQILPLPGTLPQQRKQGSIQIDINVAFLSIGKKKAEKAPLRCMKYREPSVTQYLTHSNIVAAARNCCRKMCWFVRMWLGCFVGENEQTDFLS